MKHNSLLHRQIHPNWIAERQISSQAFLPTTQHRGCLSVYDGEGITAGDAYKHYTSHGYASVGVLSVTVDECRQLDLFVRNDPLEFSEHHAVIDFEPITGSRARRRVAKQLRDFAADRGWQFAGDTR